MQLTFSKKTLFAILGASFATTFIRNRTEQAVIVSAKKRDREAFNLLMESNAAPLRRFIARRVTEGDREDVFQETWLAVWEALPSFDNSSKLRTWLYSICYHKIQDHWRREHCRPATTQIIDAEGRTAYLPPEFATVELSEALREYWESCSPDHRELLRLYYSDGLTLNEISTILGRNLNTVKYQFYRAHSEAKEKLMTAGDSDAWRGNR